MTKAKRKQSIYTLATLLCWSLAAAFSLLPAQQINLSFQRLDREKGLSQGTCPFISRDSKGFVWIATSDGLNRFDGQKVKIYRPDASKPHSLVGNIITSAAYEDEKTGDLWFTTYNAVHHYVRAYDHFDTLQLCNTSQERQVEDYYAFHLDGKGFLWLQVGTGDAAYLHVLNIRSGRDSICGPMKGTRSVAIPDQTGAVKQVLCTEMFGGGLEIIDLVHNSPPKSYFREGPSACKVHEAFVETDTLVWLGLSSGIAAFNPQTGTSQVYATHNGQPFGDVWSVCPYGKNLLFVATKKNGLWVFDRQTKRFTQQFLHEPNNSFSLLDDATRNLYIDGQENLWVAHWKYGFSYVNLRKNKFTIPPAARGNAFWKFFKGPDGNIWCSEPEKGLFVYTLNGTFIDTISNNFPKTRRLNSRHLSFISQPYFPAGSAIGFYGNCLLHWDGARRELAVLDTLSLTIKDICTTPAGKTLVATEKAIFRLVQQANGAYSFTPLPLKAGFQPINISAIFCDSRGYLYIAENTERLLICKETTDGLVFVTTISGAGSCKAFFEIPGGKGLWVAGSAGLLRIGPNFETRILNEQTDGLPNATYYGVIPDKSGRLWLTSNQGLLCYDTLLHSVNRYLQIDGLFGNEFNTGAFYQTPDGKIWVGGLGGLVIFDPENLQKVPFVPQVQITQIMVNDGPLETNQQVEVLETLNLPYSQNTISVEFVALEFSNPSANQFQYRLIGYDDQWVKSGTRGFARYANLPPGNYTLEILAANSDGVWSTTPKSLKIHIQTPFYKTWWFYLLCALAVVGLIYAWFQYRLRQVLKIERMRVQISSDLHDDVGTLLSGLAMQSEVLELSAAEKDKGKLRRIGEISRDAMARMRDTVWAIDSRKDKLENLLDRMREHAEETLTPRGIRYTIEAEQLNLKQNLPANIRQTLYLIYKEAVTNAAKHTNGDTVTVSLKKREKGLEMRICDNGSVAEKTYKTTGSGTANMQMRAEKVGGSLEISRVEGFCVHLRLKAFAVVFGVFFSTVFGLSAQTYIPETRLYGIKDGLSNRQVNDILEDRQGYIWIATPSGLNRFDGYTFRVWDREDGLQADQVERIFEDAYGFIWVFYPQAVGAIDLIDPRSNKVIPFAAHYGNKIPGGFQDKVGKPVLTKDATLYWATRSGFTTFHPDRGFRTVPIPAMLLDSTATFSLNFVSAQKIVWGIIKGVNGHSVVAVNTNGHVLQTFDHTGQVKYVRPGRSAEAGMNYYNLINEAKQSAVCLCIAADDKTCKVPAADLLPNFDYGIEINTFTAFNAAQLLFSDFRIFDVATESLLFDGIPDRANRRPRAFVLDHSGKIWVGSDFGLLLINVHKNRFRHILYNGDASTLGLACRGILEKDGQLLVNTEAAIYTVPQKTGAFEPDPTAIRRFPLQVGRLSYAIAADTSGGIFSAWEFGLDRVVLHPGTALSLEPLVQHPNLSRAQFGPDLPRTEKINYLYISWAIFPDNRQRLWVGTYRNGLFVYDLTTRQLRPFDRYNGFEELMTAGIVAIQSDRAGRIWLCATTGLYRLDLEKGILERHWSGGTGAFYLPYNNIYHFYEDQAGVFWLATGGGGLLRWDPKSGATTQFSRKAGLPNNAIYAVYEDSHEVLWLPSDFGIIQFDKKQGKVSRVYLPEDGITHLEFNRISHCRGADGTLYFGGLNGITAFNPDDFYEKDVAQQIPLVVTHFQQFDGGSNQLKDKTGDLLTTHEIVLNPDDRFFNLEFALLTYEQTDKIQYAYKIDGIDADWTYQNEPNLRMSRLPYGTHLMHIRGQAANGIWGDHELLIPIRVARPFYMTWWFYGLCALAFAGLVYSWFQYRLQQALHIERLRVQISSDLHDDVGTLLSGLAMQSEVLELTAREKDKGKLQRIGAISRDAMVHMRDTVWAIDARNDKLENLLDRMQEHAEETLAPYGIRFEIDADNLNGKQTLSTNIRQNVYLIYKEAVTNVAKHSNGNFVSIRLKKIEKGLEMSICDNGHVSEKTYKTTGAGMANMCMRAEKIGGTLEVRRENGFCVMLHVRVWA